MSALEEQALQNAAASSAMEGLPFEQRHIDTIKSILEGKTTLQDYLFMIKATYGEIQ